jgi:hypothetical protein
VKNRATESSKLFASLLALSTVVVACSSASPGEGVERLAEGVTCTPVPGGPDPASVHIECSAPKPAPVPPAPTPTPCVLYPGSTWTVPNVNVAVSSAAGSDLICTSATGFIDALTKLGCTPQGRYQPAGENMPDAPTSAGPWSVPIAYCPSIPAIAQGGVGDVLWDTIPIDSCTGTPPDGGVVVLWTSVNPCGDGKPSSGCNYGGCLPGNGGNTHY